MSSAHGDNIKGLEVPQPLEFEDDPEETVEVQVRPSHGSGDFNKKIVSLEKLVEELSRKMSELADENGEVTRRISMSMGDSQLALKNSDHSLKEIRKIKKENQELFDEIRSRLEELQKSASSGVTAPAIEDPRPAEKFNLTIADIQDRISLLEDLPDHLEEKRVDITETIDSLRADFDSLKENVDDVTGRADTALERSDKIREEIEQISILRAEIGLLEKRLQSEMKSVLKSVESQSATLAEEKLEEFSTTLEHIQKLFNEKVEFTEDQYEQLKILISANIKKQEETLKSFRADFKGEIDAVRDRMTEGLSQQVDVSALAPIVEELKNSAEERINHLEHVVAEQDTTIRSMRDSIELFINVLGGDEATITSRINEKVKAATTHIGDFEKKIKEMRTGFSIEMNTISDEIQRIISDMSGKQSKMQELMHKLVKTEKESKDLMSRRIENLTDLTKGTSKQMETALADQLKTMESKIEELKNQFEGEVAKQLGPLELQLNDISGDLGAKLEPIRQEVAAAKSFIEEEMIKVKESWNKLDKTISDSEGAMGIAQRAKESLERLDREIGEAITRIDGLMSSLRENTLQTNANADKIDLTVKLVDEARERIKNLQPGMMGAEDLALTPKEIMESPDMADMGFELDDLLMVMIKHKASDLHLKSGAPPTVRLDGELIPIGNTILTNDDCKKLILSSMGPVLRKQLARKHEVDFAYAIPDARFRVNAFLQKQSISAAFRLLWTDVPTIEALCLPPVVKRLCDFNHGLILITGPAGSGKSTTLSSMINYINENKKLHIVTVEDPIEFIHTDKMSIITQREIGSDTESFPVALKQALRQDPNVILIGEMRDPETIMTAAVAAETGHLVLSTLHTPNTVQAINRIIDVFSGDVQKQFRLLLANTLRGIISQRLLTRADGTGRIPAVEVLVATQTITSLILEEKTNEIYEFIMHGDMEGMQTFTQSLTKLYERGLITRDEAMYHADHPTELRMTIEGHTSGVSSAAQDDSLMSWL